MQYMNSGESPPPQKESEIREQQQVRRSKRLRTVAGVLTYEAYAARKAYFVGKVRFCSYV